MTRLTSAGSKVQYTSSFKNNYELRMIHDRYRLSSGLTPAVTESGNRSFAGNKSMSVEKLHPVKEIYSSTKVIVPTAVKTKKTLAMSQQRLNTAGLSHRRTKIPPFVISRPKTSSI
jgi:hypothetical protein